MINMNKRGASLSGWTEGAIATVLIMSCILIIMVSMNTQYSKSYDPTFGLSSNDTRTALTNYQGQLDSGLTGSASTNQIDGGVNLLSAWGMAKAGFTLVRDFVTGAWINNAVGLLQLGGAGDALGWGLRVLFVSSLVFILIRLIFKVNA